MFADTQTFKFQLHLAPLLFEAILSEIPKDECRNLVNTAFDRNTSTQPSCPKNPITTFTFLVFNASLSSQWLPFGLEIQSISLRLGLYIIHERFHFAVALQFCSSVITQFIHKVRFDVTDRKTKALDFAAQQASATSDELAQISSDLRMLDARIRGVIRSYSRLKTKLQSYAPERQLEAAECWVADTDGDFPPVAAGPANEDSFGPSWAWWKRE
ncbi:uncharacterized protein EV420DRAFT_1606241 [Desarmillaria tabescens]|uniref:Uncharacterized protein n=1 Tax=Armillaria tabescens TaxID=1929756 RepID=A0AA39IXJ0_ARMTA|nr:uncharacterized protein EV420DRAFT_1606241 [Desarmillaria tabescens]KAK0432293.1 hypothetical protein EV420DRAFT_1606241 [Desarmillaria tabescens]